MIDPASWLAEHRSKDKSKWPSIDLELEDKEYDSIKQSASDLSMDIEEYVNFVLTSAFLDKNVTRCGTCKRVRFDLSQQCRYCGEID